MVATLLTPISFSLFFSLLSVFFLPLSSLLPAFFLLSGWFLKLGTTSVLFFGVAVGSLTVVGAGKKKWRKRTRGEQVGGGGGPGGEAGRGEVELDMGEEVDEWVFDLDGRLRDIT